MDGLELFHHRTRLLFFSGSLVRNIKFVHPVMNSVVVATRRSEEENEKLKIADSGKDGLLPTLKDTEKIS